jgi:8-oxo-dGTP diphosphatase
MKRENEPFKNLWSFPGGKIEENEKYSEATKREIYEEIGKI